MLIGLAGYAQSGKDTVAGVFAERGFTRLSFVAAMKDELAVDLASERGVPFEEAREWLDTPVVKEQFRDRMVVLGTRRRAENPDCLIDALRQNWLDEGDYIITDCRYLNELREVAENGGVWFYIIKYTKVNGIQHDSAPANEEERHSFRAIRDAVEDGTLQGPATVWRAESGCVGELQARAREWIDEQLT